MRRTMMTDSFKILHLSNCCLLLPPVPLHSYLPASLPPSLPGLTPSTVHTHGCGSTSQPIPHATAPHDATKRGGSIETW